MLAKNKSCVKMVLWKGSFFALIAKSVYKEGRLIMRKTKIVCTIGPACSDPEVMERMLSAGMNVARFNFSHGTHEYHKELMDTFRSVRDKMKIPAAVLLDTKGPEIRFCDFENGKIRVNKGGRFALTSRDVMGNENEGKITYPKLIGQIAKGTRILVDDGKVSLIAEEFNDTDIICRVEVGGYISNHKSINIPNTSIDMPYISKKDEEDLLFGIKENVDFIAASFVRCKETATGDNPVLVVKTMSKIAEQAENDAIELGVYSNIVYDNEKLDITNAVCDAAVTTAKDLNADLIVAVTKSGLTSRRMSKFRPEQPIIAATPEAKTFHQLALSWGVLPVLSLMQKDTETLFIHAIDCAKQLGLANPGETAIITAGAPVNLSGTTNLLKVQIVD